jgi:hypothetical protein
MRGSRSMTRPLSYCQTHYDVLALVQQAVRSLYDRHDDLRPVARDKRRAEPWTRADCLDRLRRSVSIADRPRLVARGSCGLASLVVMRCPNATTTAAIASHRCRAEETPEHRSTLA